MASASSVIPNLDLEDASGARHQDSTIAAGVVDCTAGTTDIQVSDTPVASNVSADIQASDTPVTFNISGAVESNVIAALARAKGTASPSKSQGQHFEPLDKCASMTVKLNPKLELGKADLLKLLSCMEAELQARDVVIATLKSERIKNLLHYGRVGFNDPFLALQRDTIGGRVVGGTNISEGQLRNIEETQLQQLEILITQQRKAHQRMRHVLREAEKRHSLTVEELDNERKKHDHDTAQGDDVTYHLEVDRSRLKQFQEVDSERSGRKKAEKELKKALESLEEERGKQKQIVLMLVEERKRLALQYAEERKRSEDLAQILSEEKGRIDSMADGLEEESKKSLQMEAELEKQLAEFDTERQQMRSQLGKRDDRIAELEIRSEKLHHEGEHYRKQLQEAHNVAMFQQTLSVSPPRLGVGSPRAQPPQVPAKPASLSQGQQRLQATPALSNVTKAVQLTATANSVPVAGPTTGIARGVQPVGVVLRPTMYSSQSNEISRTITPIAKTYNETDGSWISNNAEIESASQTLGLTRSPVADGCRGQAQLVQVSPRVNVSASPGSKVITTTHGGKVTLHVTTNASSPTPSSLATLNGQLAGSTGTVKKPLPPARSSAVTSGLPAVPINKPVNVPPIPPNKPIVPPKKDLMSGRTNLAETPPISVEVKPPKMGTQTVKFGITISKTGGPSSVSGPSGSTKEHSLSEAVDNTGSGTRRESVQVEDSNKLHDSLSPELENFHQLLSSMAGSTDLDVALDQLSSDNSIDLCPTDVTQTINPILSSNEERNHSVNASQSSSLSNLTSNVTVDTANPTAISSHNAKAVESPERTVCESLYLNVETNHVPPTEQPPHSPLDVSSPLTEDGMTALHLAAQGNNWQSVPTLIQCGSSVYAEDENGQTPIYIALINGCTSAAKTLLSYAESLEQVTMDGSNLLHGAIKSECESCVSLLIDQIKSLSDGEGILHMLSTAPDHHNMTPIAYAINCPNIMQILVEAGLDLPALLVYSPDLGQRATGKALLILNNAEKLALKCPVWLQGASIFSETEEAPKWAIGCVAFSQTTSWADAESQVLNLLLRHWQHICRDLGAGPSNGEMNCTAKADEESVLESPLDLSESSVDCIVVGSHFWKMGSQNNGRSPYELISDNRATESSEMIIHLKPLEAIAYTCLIPASLLENYLRLLDQSKCVIVYGAKGSGKRTLVHGLATLYCGSFSRDAFTRINMDNASFESALDAVRRCFKDGSVLLLERISRHFWPMLGQTLKTSSSGRHGGRVLATMDSWRRPAGQMEYDVLRVQLRHDREPLCHFLSRWSARHMSSIGGGVLPPVTSQWYETVKWIGDSYRMLSDILMSLGFSTVLTGPHLFARQLTNSFNARDAFVKMNEVWWENLAPAICKEVDHVWNVGQQTNKDCQPDKTRVSAMALHVIQQRTFLCELPPCARFYPKSIFQASEAQTKPLPPPRPKDLHLHSNGPTKTTPLVKRDAANAALSPEWTPDNLSKILGLAPMGYL